MIVEDEDEIMQKVKRTGLIRNIRSYTFMILISLLAIFSISILIDRIIIINNTKNRIYNDNMKHQTEIIREEILIVDNVINHYIDHNHDKNEIIDYLRNIRFGENNDRYIFVVTYDGTTLVNGTKRELEGKNIWDMEDPNGIKVIQEERKAAEKPGGDFIYYSWERPSTGKISPKVSFIIGIPEWEWMFGTGVYLDTVDEITAIEVKKIYKTLILQLVGLILFIALVFSFIYIRFKRFSGIVSEDISVINNCFINAELTQKPFNISEIKYDEFSVIGEHANKMIFRQKKAEREKEDYMIRLRLQREQSPLAYVDWNFDNKIIGWNQAAESIFGYSREEAIGKSYDLIIPDFEKSDVDNLFQNLGKETNQAIHTNLNITKGGQIITCEWYNNNLIDDNGNALGITAIAIDITERLRSQNEIEVKNTQLGKSIKEKNILLQEVHHRVKNNMAVISSMIALQSNTIDDEHMKELLQSSQNRIQSMTMVHENIYKNESLSEVNVNTYVLELIESLMQSFDLFDNQIELNIDVLDINLELDLLIPLGMIINEIVSNSFKHAYREGKAFELSVILKDIDTDKMYMCISDNGPGFNEDETTAKEGSIGLMLIRGLVDQIDGRLKITTKDKTVYEIYF
jgi:PAS domain S-box-containing protein